MRRAKIIARNLLLLGEIDNIDSKLDFEVCVFKGASFLVLGLSRIDEREMSDLDFIIPKDRYDSFLLLLYKNGYRKIKDGRHSFYKEVSNELPPIIIDAHKDFWGLAYDDFERIDIGYRYVKSLSFEDLFLTASLHSILNHGYFDKKTYEDLKRIIERSDDGFIERVIAKANSFGFGLIVALVLQRVGFKIYRFRYTFRELVSYPFVKLSFNRHIVLNEYLLTAIYNPFLIGELFKKPSKMRNIILRIFGRRD